MLSVLVISEDIKLDRSISFIYDKPQNIQEQEVKDEFQSIIIVFVVDVNVINFPSKVIGCEFTVTEDGKLLKELPNI